MRSVYFLLSIVSLIFVSCSSTYNVTDFPSTEKFKEDINSSIKNRDINVVTFDSSFTSLAGSEIKGDSLLTVAKIQEEKISLKDVKNVKYFSHANEIPSAYVWLKNGKELKAESIKELPDSVIQLTNLTVNSGHVPINKVQEISYKTSWQSTLIGIPLGFAGGAVAGGILGATGTIIRVNNGGNHPSFDSGDSFYAGFVLGAVIGTVTGTILGYILGWNHIYRFSH